MIEPDEAAFTLMRLDPRMSCDCPAGTYCYGCTGIARRWMETATTLKVPTAALAALARGDAVVVPRVLTTEMAEAMERAPASGGLGAGRTFQDWWQPTWKVALSKSPYKGGA